MFIYYVNVPLNDSGIEEFESCAEEMPNVYTEELSEEEYKVLRKPNGLFQLFDQTFGIIIDVCEEERIEKNQVEKAIELAENRLKKIKNPIEISAINKMLQALIVARESETFCEIDIYLE